MTENSGIKIARSYDGGDTWTGEKKIVNNRTGINECVPDLLQLADGTIIVGYNPRPTQPYSADRRFGIRCKISRDNGETWSDEIYIYDASHTYDDGCWEPHFLQLPSGELQCYFADESPYTSSNEQQISVCRSTDGGLTWSAPECVSFRPGCRDGMPAAILLEDPDEIVVIVEDNGWYGNMGNFTPTTVRCPLATNWHDYHVGGPDDTNRNMIYTFKPGKNMAAPYIKKLADGTTVASCQGLYKRTSENLDLWVAVGDKRARNFKSLSRPLSLPESKSSMWNSLAVIDGDVVVAVGGIDRSIKMIKGYPVSTVGVARAKSVNVNGVADEGELFSGESRKLLPMGTESRNPSYIDMVWDDDYLYLTASVDDREIVSDQGKSNDQVTVYLDPQDLRTTKLAVGLYRVTMNVDGSLTMSESKGRTWGASAAVDGALYKVVTDADGYLMEAAIPWSALKVSDVSAGRKMRMAAEISQAGASATVKDVMTDVVATRSETWMPVSLLAEEAGAAISLPSVSGDSGVTVVSEKGRITVDSALPMESVRVYSLSGTMLCGNLKIDGGSCHEEFIAGASGLALVAVTLTGGMTVTRKIILK